MCKSTSTHTSHMLGQTLHKQHKLESNTAGNDQNFPSQRQWWSYRESGDKIGTMNSQWSTQCCTTPFFLDNDNNYNDYDYHNNNNNNSIHSSISTEWFFIWVISASDIGQAASTREIPLLFFEKCCGIFKVPHIGLVEVRRLGQQLNVPTQGWRVVQAGDIRPFTSGAGIRSPARNRIQATLVGGGCTGDTEPTREKMSFVQ